MNSFLTGAVLLACCAMHTHGATISQSPREVALVREVDVVVVGGTLGAVSAAIEASRSGARVLLVAQQTYLGEDLCANLHLWREPGEDVQGELTQRIFGSRDSVTPLHVKQTLEAAMLKAGVEFLLVSYATDVLVDAKGAPAGIVIANRSGRQAVVAGHVIDATDRGIVAELAGARRRPAPLESVPCTRVVLGGIDGPDTLPTRSIPADLEYQGQPLRYHEYALTLDLGDGGYGDLAEAEQQARDRTYRDGQVRAAERIRVRWPDPLRCCESAAASETEHGLDGFRPFDVPHVHVLSAAAEVPRDKLDTLLRPPVIEQLGRRIGQAATLAANRRGTPTGVTGRSTGSRNSEEAGAAGKIDIRELLQGLRSHAESAATVPLPAAAVPVLETVDVLVIGGGTSGACAAIAAGRQGTRVLVVEYQAGLGGVGTLGLIGHPYHGQNIGFTREVPFPDKTQNTEHKMEWYRRRIRETGGSIWLNALGCGAVVQGDRVRGAVVATPVGRGVVMADVVIDATGNADLAIAAGADYRYGGDGEDIALQGSGLPLWPLNASYVNTDYLLVDEADALDTWRALVGVRLAAASSAYDVGSFIQNRERRRVVGDHTLTYLDQIAGRRYPDTIVLSGSDYDSHGYPSELYFALIPHTAKTLKANHPAPGGTCDTPYRCLLPRGLEGILAIGLGISMHRDASAMVRMQRDMHNQGYAAGVAAAMAVRSGCTPRQIDVRELQRHLVEVGNLPERVLEDIDSFPVPEVQLREAVHWIGDHASSRDARCRALAVVLSQGDRAIPMLKQAYEAAGSDVRLDYAKILGVLGERDVIPPLVEALDRIQVWDDKILQGRMAEFAHLPTPTDAIILALGATGDRRATPAVLRKLAMLDADVTLSHHRATAMALERLRDPAAAEPLARLLAKPGIRGHVMTELEPLYDSAKDRRRRLGPLREIVLARSLYRCGDWDGLGESVLREYVEDIRGLFSRHAQAVLRDAPAR